MSDTAITLPTPRDNAFDPPPQLAKLRANTPAHPLNAPNRDPSKLDNPDTFDITRDAAGRGAFGHGAHQCIGHQLARMEVRIGLATPLDRFGRLRLAAQPRYTAVHRYDDSRCRRVAAGLDGDAVKLNVDTDTERSLALAHHDITRTVPIGSIM